MDETVAYLAAAVQCVAVVESIVQSVMRVVTVQTSARHVSFRPSDMSKCASATIIIVTWPTISYWLPAGPPTHPATHAAVVGVLPRQWRCEPRLGQSARQFAARVVAVSVALLTGQQTAPVVIGYSSRCPGRSGCKTASAKYFTTNEHKSHNDNVWWMSHE